MKDSIAFVELFKVFKNIRQFCNKETIKWGGGMYCFELSLLVMKVTYFNSYVKILKDTNFVVPQKPKQCDSDIKKELKF